jgi:hypothetical protein
VIATEEIVSVDMTKTVNATSLLVHTPLPRVLWLHGAPRARICLFSSTLSTFLYAFVFLPVNKLNQRILVIFFVCLWLRLRAVRYRDSSGQLLLWYLRRAQCLPDIRRDGRCVRVSPHTAFLLARMTVDSGRQGCAHVAPWRAGGGGQGTDLGTVQCGTQRT